MVFYLEVCKWLKFDSINAILTQKHKQNIILKCFFDFFPSFTMKSKGNNPVMSYNLLKNFIWGVVVLAFSLIKVFLFILSNNKSMFLCCLHHLIKHWNVLSIYDSPSA